MNLQNHLESFYENPNFDIFEEQGQTSPRKRKIRKHNNKKKKQLLKIKGNMALTKSQKKSLRSKRRRKNTKHSHVRSNSTQILILTPQPNKRKRKLKNDEQEFKENKALGSPKKNGQTKSGRIGKNAEQVRDLIDEQHDKKNKNVSLRRYRECELYFPPRRSKTIKIRKKSFLLSHTRTRHLKKKKVKKTKKKTSKKRSLKDHLCISVNNNAQDFGIHCQDSGVSTPRKLQRSLSSHEEKLIDRSLLTKKERTEMIFELVPSFAKLLTLTNGTNYFSHFLKSEYSNENLEFYLDVCKFKKLQHDTNEQEITEQTKRIIDTYIRSGAGLEINIDYFLRKQILAMSTKKPLSLTIFDSAQQKIFNLMESDSFQRFFTHPIAKKLYLELKKNKKTKKNILKTKN
ncbi:regulator of g protein signaling [Anaeramoeba flamelloides]|uniref:Regulator of g protein signaling n=1 Tax=Anaeramoeba flamelloides TaxID=1746091 RepID=A0ABQ8YUI5_9EUKA|nr:regulator of g protein signaling [Anaeramoeba flamelloides]